VSATVQSGDQPDDESDNEGLGGVTIVGLRPDRPPQWAGSDGDPVMGEPDSPLLFGGPAASAAGPFSFAR